MCRCVYIKAKQSKEQSLCKYWLQLHFEWWTFEGAVHTQNTFFAFTVLLLHWKNVLDKHVWEVRGHYLNAMREQMNKVFIRLFLCKYVFVCMSCASFIVFFLCKHVLNRRWVLCLLQCLAHGMLFYKKWSSSKTLKTKKHAEALCFFVPLPCTPLLF